MPPDDAPPFEPLFHARRDDDLSSHRHRVVIGSLGAALPLLVSFISWLRPTNPKLTEPLSSISAYYYSGAVAVFTGILAGLAIYFFTYSGYDNAHRWKDRTTSVIAGFAAIGVACFPTIAPVPPLELPWWHPYLGTIHFFSATALFGGFIVFALFLFPKSRRPRKDRPPEKKARNVVYYACGLTMLVCMTIAGVRSRQGHPIFWLESVALEAFAVSWLVKGRAHWTAKQLLDRARRPVAFAKHVVSARQPRRGRPSSTLEPH
jgi:hypothetical protein